MKSFSIIFTFFVSSTLILASLLSPDNSSATIRMIFYGIGFAGITYALMESFSVSAFPFMQKNYLFRNISNVSIHEAGHALVSGFQDYEDIETRKVSKTEGYTRCKGIHDFKIFSLQIMAGSVAEELVFGFSGPGSCLDMIQWHKSTDLVLRLEKGNAVSDDKVEIIFRQRQYLLRFFHENFNVLLDLARAIEKGKKLTKADLAPYHARLKIENFENLFFPTPPQKSVHAAKAGSIRRVHRVLAR